MLHAVRVQLVWMAAVVAISICLVKFNWATMVAVDDMYDPVHRSDIDMQCVACISWSGEAMSCRLVRFN